MSKDWKARRLVMQAKLRFPDGTEREATFQIVPDFPGHGEADFIAARVFVAHERIATYDMRLITTEGTEKVQRGSIISVAGDHFDVPIAEPKAGVPFIHDRLNVVPPPEARASKQA